MALSRRPARSVAVCVIAGVMLAACGDSDDNEEPAGDDASAAYCALVKESVEMQTEVGPAGPTPEQEERMIEVASKLREDAPDELSAAYEELDALSGSDASGAERVEAMRAYSEAINAWTKARCDPSSS